MICTALPLYNSLYFPLGGVKEIAISEILTAEIVFNYDH